MQRHERSRAHVTRRSFLGGLGLAVAGVGVVTRSSAATDATFSIEAADQFVLEQGDRCVPVTPLSGDVPVEERYGWAVDGADFSATGLVDLQRPDTSVLFLYDGPNGLSLVVLHDRYGDGTAGGSATFEFAGLPLDGEWAVQDDYYDADSNYDQWVRDGDVATVDWTWGDGRTDGGAFRGLGAATDLEIRITPSFNAEAALYGEYYDGEVTDWEVLSAGQDGPTRTSLALDEPVVVRRGTCSTDGTSDGGGDDERDADDSDGDTEDGEDADAEEREASDDDDWEEDDGDEEDGDDDDDDHPVKGEGDDHPGKGKGHENGRGKGHDHGKGKGHDRHGDDHDDEREEDDSPGKGRGKGKGKGKRK